jgi:hypothetical protein
VLDNWEVVIVGGGGRNIWFNDFGTDDTQPKYEIITINAAIERPPKSSRVLPPRLL